MPIVVVYLIPIENQQYNTRRSWKNYYLAKGIFMFAIKHWMNLKKNEIRKRKVTKESSELTKNIDIPAYSGISPIVL